MRAALDQRVLGQLGGLGVVLDRLGHVGVVLRLALAGRLVEVVVAVAEEEVGGEEVRGSFGIRLGSDHSFVTVGGLVPARRPVLVVGLLEGLHGLQVVERILATAGRGGAEPDCEHCKRHRRRPISGLHVLPRGAHDEVRAEKWVLEWCRHERGGLTRPEPRQYSEPKIAPSTCAKGDCRVWQRDTAGAKRGCPLLIPVSVRHRHS